MNDEQRVAIEKSKQSLQSKYTDPIRTTIAAAGKFTEAEGYHQKYYLQVCDSTFWCSSSALCCSVPAEL